MRLMGHHTVPVNYSKSDEISCRPPDFKNYEIKNWLLLSGNC